MTRSELALDKPPLATRGRTLTLRGVSHRWPRAEANLLVDVDLDIAGGTATALRAPNGTGKTTLLRIAAGLIRPESGRVRLGELDAEGDRLTFQRRVGFLSASSAGLYARLSVRHHLRLWAKLALLPRDAAADACARMSDAFELGPLLDSRVDRLSSGQRQRVRLSAAFLHEPDVVLLDEPTNSLDEAAIAGLAGELERTRTGGRAVLWCGPTGERDIVNPDRRLTIDRARLVSA
jgi:ABC-type multidrug transport system ATPase subunit